MKIFVDFDNTIFDTRHVFLDAFFAVFEKYGVSQQVFDDTLSHFSKTAVQDGPCYTPREHIREIIKKTKIHLDEDTFVTEINHFLEHVEDCVFVDFYQFAHLYDKKDLIILSYGDDDFQMRKIKGSGIVSYFLDIIITQGDKIREIEKYMKKFPGQSAMLIDDKNGYFTSAKKSTINVCTIHMMRDGECDNILCDHHVHRLHDVKSIL